MSSVDDSLNEAPQVRYAGEHGEPDITPSARRPRKLGPESLLR